MVLSLVMVRRPPTRPTAESALTHHSQTALGRWSREHYLLAGVFGVLGTLLVAIVPGFANATRVPPPAALDPITTVSLTLPPAAASTGVAGDRWQFVQVRSGQTLGSIFAEQHLPAELVARMMSVPAAQPLARLREGQELGLELDGDGALKTLRFNASNEKRVDLVVAADGITGTVVERPLEHRIQIGAGTITRSLYADGAKAGLSISAINEMANIFKYDIDFVEDVRDGDTFQVVYEELWRDGQRVGAGGVIGATFTNRGKRYSALRFERDGKVEFFDETGRPLRKTLMRIPIEFARLSSTFGARKHPVLGRMRMHKGVDYAARSGTPIMAAGDGKVSFVGWRNGYGRAVIIDHGNNRSTLYGHMSAWGKYKTGQRVAQGSTIGYVGMTGLATGPHLHYEFRINGTQVNPLTVTMPKPEPLGGAELVRFRAATAPALAKLQLVEQRNTRLAMR
jgi:murein DD-endopeptidase MepM/ murein hydrolase activator NlpD